MATVGNIDVLLLGMGEEKEKNEEPKERGQTG